MKLSNKTLRILHTVGKTKSLLECAWSKKHNEVLCRLAFYNIIKRVEHGDCLYWCITTKGTDLIKSHTKPYYVNDTVFFMWRFSRSKEQVLMEGVVKHFSENGIDLTVDTKEHGEMYIGEFNITGHKTLERNHD